MSITCVPTTRRINMKNILKISPWIACLIVLPILSRAQSAADAPAVQPTAPSKGPSEEKKTDLEVQMDKMGKAIRKLKKQIGDPTQNASSLELLSTMEGASKEALNFTPAKAADLPEDQRAKFVDDFRAGIKDLQARFAKLQEALEAGKNADAVAMLGEIQDFEKKEHKEFRKPKPD